MGPIIDIDMIVRDRISGLTGTVTCIARYASGPLRIQVSPPLNVSTGEYVEPQWFDEDRLVVIEPADF